MSLYEMLPQKQPQAEIVPESGDSRRDDIWLDPFSALADEALEAEISLGGPQNALAGDAAAPAGEPPPEPGDETGLQTYIREAFAKKLPQIAEYREKGYNLSGPDEGALKQLQAVLDGTARAPETRVLAEPARRFLTFLLEMALNDRNMSPVLQEAVLQADRLLNLLVTALEALAAGARVGPLDWEAEARKQARQARDRLVADLPDAGEEARRQAGFSLTSESFLLTPEYRKFTKLRDSLLAESRIVRHRLTAHLEEKTARTEEGARDVREYALNTLLAQSAAKPSGTPEQLAVWGARFQQYARHLPGRDDSFDSALLAGNPLAAALSSVMKPSADEPLHVRLARAMLPVTAALGGATALLVQAQQRVALPETETKKITVKPHEPLLQKVRTAGRGVLTGTVNLARKTGHRTVRGAFRARHVLHRVTDPDGLNRAVRNTGLLLLDEIQQTERQMSRLATQAWLLQEATEQQWRVEEEPASLAVTQPELAARLDAALAQEAVRWQLIAQQALTQLETLLASSARLTETAFYSELSEELQQARALSEEQRFPDIARMAETMTGVADGLAGIVRGLNSAVIRLSEHGYAGGAELNALLGSYRRELNQLKAQVKTRVTGITGSSLANFSRGGMLARGVAEWAEALKQAWLAGLPPAQRAEARVQFERALMTVLAENREHFAGKSDPQAEGFMKRLTLALQHAATGSQVYPPTAEEILAGSRSVPEDVRRWAERKVLGGALWAALRGGFNLVTGPVSLPVRVAIRGARTGYTLAGGLRQMNRVRLGEGPATLVKRQYISQEMAKIGIRLALSLSPVTGWGVAVTVTLTEAGKNLHDRKALKKMAKRFALNIPEEGLWAGGYAGTRAAIGAIIRARTEQAVQEAVEKMLTEARASAAVRGATNFDTAGYLQSLLAQTESNNEEPVTAEDDDQQKEDGERAVLQALIPKEITTIRKVEAIEGSVEGTLQSANDAQQTETTDDPAPSDEQKPARRKKRSVALNQPRVKSFAGSKTAAVSPISRSAQESTNEADDETSRSRAKRVAETEELTPSRYYYPAPVRETVVDAELVKRVLQTFPYKNGFRIPAKDATLSADRQKVYHHDGNNYLYIGGRYRYIKITSRSEDGAWEADVYPYQRPESADNKALKIKFNINDDTWHLADESEGNVTIDPDVVTTMYVTWLTTEDSKAAEKMPAEKAYTDAQVQPGFEGQIYDDGESKYIFLGGRYWPIKFIRNDTFIIPAESTPPLMYTYQIQKLTPAPKPGSSTDSQKETETNASQREIPHTVHAVEPRKMPVRPDDATANKEQLPAPTLSATLRTHAENWRVADPLQKAYPIAGVEGAVYKKNNDELVIYINDKYWPFIFIGERAGAVFVTENNQQKAIIIYKDKGAWQYIGENITKDFLLFISTLEQNNFDQDIQDEISDVLAEYNISWGDMLRKLNNAINKQFNRLYTEPAGSKLENIIWLRFVVSGYLDSLAISQHESESESLVWNSSLLSLYQTAFAKDIDDNTKLAIAQQVLYLKGNIENNIKALSTTSLEKSISKMNTEIAEKAAAIHFHKIAISNARAEEVKTNLNRALEKLEKQHTEFIKKRDALQSVLNNIKDKKLAYQRDIKNYTAQYGNYWAGIALGKEVFNRHLAQPGGKANLSQAAVKSLIELALQEVAITSKVRIEYTESELRELEKIRVARAEVKQLLVRQQFFQSLVPLVESSDIPLPDAKGSYEDIRWANEQGEKLSETVASADNAAERNVFLSAILYWLIKHGKKAAELKDKNIDDIIDEYSIDVQKFNPLTQEKTVPEGYVPLSGMMGSEFFELQTKFNEQFSNYKDKFSAYDASERTKEILLISGLSVEEVSQSVTKKVRLRISYSNSIDKPENGELLFLQLPDSRWVFFSLFPGAVTTKIFTHSEMMANDYLKAIATMDTRNEGEGISEVYDSDFFASKYNFNAKRLNNYKDSDVRWNDINAGLMYGALYTDELINGEPVPDFLKNGMAYSVSYNTRDNESTSDTVVSAVNNSMRAVLNQSANALKSDLYTPSVLQKVAFTLVPFYKEIYHASTDKDYQPDVGSIILDVVSVVSVAAQAGMKAAAIIKNTSTLGKIMQQGARNGLSGKTLRVYAVQELAKESAFSALKMLKVGALATIDLVDPVSARSLAQVAINRISNTNNFRKLFLSASASTEQSLLSKHARSTLSLENMQAHTLHGATVYSSAGNGSTGPFFIKIEKDVYEVRWDEGFQTWRTVDPEHPDVLSYGVSVKQENDVWVVSDADNARPAATKDTLPDAASDMEKAGDAGANKTMMFAGLAPENPVRAAARRSRYAQGPVKESGEYAAQLLEDAKLLSSESATALKEGLKQALSNPSKEIDELFSSRKIIDSEEKLLRVKQGEILLFSEVGADGNATRHIHVMVSLGNGRFAGVKNSVLGSTLNDSKSILTAEQLGEFSNNAFKRRGDDSLPTLQIIAGEPKNFLRPEYPSLKSLAENLHGLPDDVDIAAKSTELLKQAGELATEQAAALQESLTTLLKAAKGGTAISATAESLLSSAVKVTDRAALQAMEKGKLVLFGNTSSPSFAVHHLMYSLGNGDFMMVNPHLLDKSLVSKNGIINASQFPDELFTKYGVLSGDISLSRLRLASLLGRDASFFVNGPVLTVRLHGAAGIVNFMDAYELSEVIKGLGLRETPPVKLGQIRKIKLESCFGAFGFLPTGKALAHILGKKVTAYPLKFSNAVRDTRNLFKRAKVYMPADFPSADLITQMEKQQARNHDFWNRLLGMYAAIKAKKTKLREALSFEDSLANVAELAAGKTDVATFLEKTPDYKSGMDGDVKDLEALCKGEVSDAQAFAERCIDIISMSNNVVKQLNSQLGGE